MKRREKKFPSDMFVLVFEIMVNDLFDERKNERHRRVADQLHVCTRE